MGNVTIIYEAPLGHVLDLDGQKIPVGQPTVISEDQLHRLERSHVKVSVVQRHRSRSRSKQETEPGPTLGDGQEGEED